MTQNRHFLTFRLLLITSVLDCMTAIADTVFLTCSGAAPMACAQTGVALRAPHPSRPV